MNIFALSGLLIAVFVSIIAILVFVKGRCRFHYLWGAFCITVGLWGIGGFMIGITKDIDIAILWWRIAYIGVIFIPILFTHFVYEFLNISKRWFLGIIYLLGLFFLIANFIDGLFIDRVRWVFNQFYYISPPTPLYTSFVILFFGLVIYSHIKLWQAYKSSQGIKKTQIKYILFATSVGFVGGSFSFLPVYKIDFYPFFNFTVFFSPIIVTYAILRYRLMDIRVVIRQSSVYIVSFISVVVVVILLMVLENKYFTGVLSTSWLALSGAVLGALLFHPLTNLYLKIANRYFFYSLYSYQETLINLSRRLVAILDLKKLSQTIAQEIIDIMKLDKAGLLLRDVKSDKYQIQHITGFKEENGISLVKDNFLTQWLEKIQRPLIYEELSLQIRDAKKEEIRQNLTQLKSNMKRIEAELCLPLMSKEKIIGIIVLGKKLSGESYNIQDLSLLETLANQASLAIENARLYEQVEDLTANLSKRVDEQTKEIRAKSVSLEETLKKNQALSEMKTAFLRVVNHQLRTPTSIIKGMLSMLVEGSIEGQEKRDEAIGKIYVSAERLETILDDLLNAQDLTGAKPIPNLSPCDLGALINKIIEHFSASAKQKNISLLFEKPAKSLPPILLDELLIEKTLKKIIDNAILYTNQGGITIKTAFIKQKQKEFVQIIIQDTGIGITEEDKTNLFKIFSRGREAEQLHPNGSGLGLYIVKEYVEAHQGKIGIESQGKDKGTSFIIGLPVVTEV